MIWMTFSRKQRQGGAKALNKQLFNCNRCEHLKRTYYFEAKQCSITYLKNDAPQIVHRDENGDFVCKEYKKKW